MIKIFIKKGWEKTGIGRYAFGMSVAENTQVYLFSNFDELHKIDISEAVGIFAGYTIEELKDVFKLFRRSYYVFCSPFGQAELSGPQFITPELALLYDLIYLRHNKEITNIICTSYDLAKAIGAHCLPAIIIKPDKTMTMERSGYSFVGNNFRKHKNVANTLAAIRMMPHSTVYVSNPDLYSYYQSVFGLEFVQCKHSEDSEFHLAISKHKLLFQCSYSESFNYLALEYAFHGIPCICSPTIHWYPARFCMVKNVDSPLDIYKTANEVLQENNYLELSNKLPEIVDKFNSTNIEYMKEGMSRLL